ncbi:Asp-tRNA(Asn)/Glu-tRNA(Gln) amidotransferase subunit GatC [Weissella diestrammenae]|uniref:Aspartyl/glutamyl-tRNA(Asn/Gln) amidotransferase subunit C n=1 Tax=Weissella diestrammenae TaxID=1162633 RepID=A0A7G9T668_9LACO|nr:Asp-tRNA(Asn)/Glu-tRNA(Gln) amidotransferase subunit GatC [Weissella diestrammenae]MCM0583366.1 Asp-tRNA(Asn)/Glu-tRNA(Gln) amidotransferase subunit GatC [Weissella diestrammenae]QNN75593.1 Asp-tRNA(Asn)/Glu-tRNA(Gln) amidotransferase subunit GatC [Weissella diestrammenae]
MADSKITESEVLHVAALAKLALSKSEAQTFTAQLEKIFDLVDMMAEVDTSGVKPTYTVAELENNLREDQPEQANQMEALLNNAPERQETLIKVPAILSEGETK